MSTQLEMQKQILELQAALAASEKKNKPSEAAAPNANRNSSNSATVVVDDQHKLLQDIIDGVSDSDEEEMQEFDKEFNTDKNKETKKTGDNVVDHQQRLLQELIQGLHSSDKKEVSESDTDDSDVSGDGRRNMSTNKIKTPVQRKNLTPAKTTDTSDTGTSDDEERQEPVVKSKVASVAKVKPVAEQSTSVKTKPSNTVASSKSIKSREFINTDSDSDSSSEETVKQVPLVATKSTAITKPASEETGKPHTESGKVLEDKPAKNKQRLANKPSKFKIPDDWIPVPTPCLPKSLRKPDRYNTYLVNVPTGVELDAVSGVSVDVDGSVTVKQNKQYSLHVDSYTSHNTLQLAASPSHEDTQTLDWVSKEYSGSIQISQSLRTVKQSNVMQCPGDKQDITLPAGLRQRNHYTGISAPVKFLAEESATKKKKKKTKDSEENNNCLETTKTEVTLETNTVDSPVSGIKRKKKKHRHEELAEEQEDSAPVTFLAEESATKKKKKKTKDSEENNNCLETTKTDATLETNTVDSPVSEIKKKKKKHRHEELAGEQEDSAPVEFLAEESATKKKKKKTKDSEENNNCLETTKTDATLETNTVDSPVSEIKKKKKKHRREELAGEQEDSKKNKRQLDEAEVNETEELESPKKKSKLKHSDEHSTSTGRGDEDQTSSTSKKKKKKRQQEE